MKKQILKSFLLFAIFTILANSSVFADNKDVKGKLVVCIASKGDYDRIADTPGSKEGLIGMAELAHKYGFPVTYYLKPGTINNAKEELTEWHKKYGDEVGWLTDGTALNKASDVLQQMRNMLPGVPIQSSGQLRYGSEWVDFFNQNGITSVWGRCYEQSATDGITDRGCPYGFYYARPDCFKTPNTGNGGVISIPWLSNDLNLVFRTAQQSTFTTDPNDMQGLDVSTPTDDSYWVAELNEYKKQTKYNKIVPLVIQQEISEFDFSSNPKRNAYQENGKAILENLYKILKREGIEVVTVAKAVEMYKAANPQKTPPTYGIYGNIAKTTAIVANCSKMIPVQSPFSIDKKAEFHCYGPTFNGYYATGKVNGILYYYDKKARKLKDFSSSLSYYDKNGLLIFDEGNPTPIRITPYSNLPEDAYKTAILPEFSSWYNTDQFIPTAEVKITKIKDGILVSIKATAVNNFILNGKDMPYGVMIWGDYSKYNVGKLAPEGTKILNTDGLFIPMILKEGENVLKIEFKI